LGKLGRDKVEVEKEIDNSLFLTEKEIFTELLNEKGYY
jgi:hypothetical protein